MNVYPLSNLINPKLSPEFKCKLTGEKIIRTTKINIYPTHDQRKILRRWFDWYRWAYNQAVFYLRSLKKLPSPTKTRNSLRQKWKNDHRINSLLIQSKIPAHSLSDAILDVSKAYKSAFTNIKRGYIKYFRMRPKKSKSPVQTMSIESAAFSKRYNSFCIRALGKYIKTSNPIKSINRDSRLAWYRKTDKFVLYVPTEVDIVKPVSNRHSECSLDPGIRTFQTLYSNNHVCEFGTQTSQKVKKILSQIESKKSHEGNKWYKKFSQRRYDKIKHIVDDLHWQTARLLCEQYDTILIGNMSTRSIVNRRGNLHKSVRSVSNLMRHFTFRQRLIAKAEELSATVHIVDESYTSKTCGSCFVRNNNLGSSKIFKCQSCTFEWGRDFNGARNIMLKHHGLF